LEYLNVKAKPADMKQWNEMLYTCINPKNSVTIAIAGKYTELKDSYKSIYEALKHGGFANDSAVKIKYVDLDSANLMKELAEADAIIAPDGALEPGSLEKKLEVIKYAREKNVPFFGICLGMQCAVIEFARNVCNLKDADSQEFNVQTKNPVIIKSIAKNAKGDDWRLGSWHCSVKKGSKAFESYKTESVSERHRHKFEFNSSFASALEKSGLVVSGINPEMKFVEIIELSNHPWFVGVQFNPEFQSRPVRPHPLFKGFIEAALKRKGSKANA
jgi:CTP synthase